MATSNRTWTPPMLAAAPLCVQKAEGSVAPVPTRFLTAALRITSSSSFCGRNSSKQVLLFFFLWVETFCSQSAAASHFETDPLSLCRSSLPSSLLPSFHPPVRELTVVLSRSSPASCLVLRGEAAAAAAASPVSSSSLCI